MNDLGHGVDVGDVAWIGFGSSRSKDEHRANAQLIAVAPELLAMLQRTVNWGGFSSLQELGKAKLLIAKATGKEIP